MAYRLYTRMKMRNITVEEQVQWVLSYVQEELVDIWKENMIENLESESLSYAMVGEFLSDLKEEFRREDNETMKVVKLKKIKQGNKIIEKFVQEFRGVTRGSGYEGRLFVEKLKRDINRVIR